jgi:hypothetical protein
MWEIVDTPALALIRGLIVQHKALRRQGLWHRHLHALNMLPMRPKLWVAILVRKGYRDLRRERVTFVSCFSGEGGIRGIATRIGSSGQ